MQKSVIALAVVFLLGSAWAQKSDTPGSQAATKAVNPPSVSAPTQTYKGTLVDASCAGNVTQQAPAAKADSTAADRDDASKSGKSTGEQSCAVSANTKEFAMRTKEGRVLRFDSVGNDRAADAIKNQKKWTAAMAAGKTITVKVGGISLDGDNLTVITLD